MTTGSEPNEAIASSTSLEGVDDTQLGRRLGRDVSEQRASENLVPLDLGAVARGADGARALREQLVDDARLERFVG